MRKLDGQRATRKLLRSRAPMGEHASVVGRIAPGNIDLRHRPHVRNPDGTVSTVRSISIGPANRQVLIPTVVGRRVVSDAAARQHYLATGKRLGVYSSIPAANRAGMQIHEQQARMGRRRR